MLIISPDREYVFNTYNFYIDQSANMSELCNSMYSYHTYGLLFGGIWCRSAIEDFYIKYEGNSLIDMNYSMLYKNLLFILKVKDGGIYVNNKRLVFNYLVDRVVFVGLYDGRLSVVYKGKRMNVAEINFSLGIPTKSPDNYINLGENNDRTIRLFENTEELNSVVLTRNYALLRYKNNDEVAQSWCEASFDTYLNLKQSTLSTVVFKDVLNLFGECELIGYYGSYLSKIREISDGVFVYNENDILYLIYHSKCIKLPSDIKIAKRYVLDNESSSLFLVRKNNKVYLSINDTIYEVENQGGMLRNTKDTDDVYYSDEKLFKLIRRKTLLGQPT